MHNNQQIAFPIDRPLVQPVQYDVNRPPFVPQLQIAPQLMQYLPYLSGVMMDIITRGIAGPVSMHLYNHLSSGQQPWANEDFVREVHNCADFIFLKAFTQGQQADPGQAIAQLAPAYIQLRSMFEVKLFSGLWHYIDPVDQNNINQQIMAFEREMAAIVQFRQGVATQGVAVPVGQPMMSGRPVAYAAPVANGYPAPVQPVQPAYPQVGSVAGRGPGGGRDYGNTATVTPVAAPAPVPQYQPVAAAAPQPVPQPAVQAQPQGEGMDNIVDSEGVTWKPTEAMPYPMAYNPVTTQMCYKIENGKTIPFPIKNDKIDMLNYDRHNISTLYGKPPENMKVATDQGEVVRALASGVKAAETEQDNADTHGERVEELHGLKAILTANSLEAAIYDVRTEMLAKIDRDNRPMVFQAYAQIYTPIVGDTHEYALLRKFADSSSYIELREKLRSAGGTGSPELITEVSLRLTALMNTILHKQLSIAPVELTVEDFAKDLDLLLSLLKSNYGEKVQKAFLYDQQRRIQELFNFPDIDEESGKAIHEALSSNALTTAWDDREDKPVFTFFGSTVRLSFLNVISHDLLLAGLSQVGNMLTKQQSPALLDLAHQVFSADDNGQLVARQLVITRDGRILELHQPLLVQGGYLASLVK